MRSITKNSHAHEDNAENKKQELNANIDSSNSFNKEDYQYLVRIHKSSKLESFQNTHKDSSAKEASYVSSIIYNTCNLFHSSINDMK